MVTDVIRLSSYTSDQLTIIVSYIPLIWEEVRKTFCVSEQKAFVCSEATERVPDSASWQSRVCGADSGLLTPLPLAHSSASFLAALCSIWLIERTLAVAAWQFLHIVHKLSVKKWLFNNIAFTAAAQGPVGHYRAITSEILVWTSGGKLMCYCDERCSLWGVAARAQQGREDQLQMKL